MSIVKMHKLNGRFFIFWRILRTKREECFLFLRLLTALTPPERPCLYPPPPALPVLGGLALPGPPNYRRFTIFLDFL
nr:MAG TPA: hypothetical protein [Caudoviricetes sp.]